MGSGLKIIFSLCLPDIYETYQVLILVPFEDEITAQLNSLDVPPVKIWRIDFYFEDLESEQYYTGNIARLKRIYDRLGDDLSRETYETVLNYRINREIHKLREISLPRNAQYFPSNLSGLTTQFLSNNEVFVDAGAFTGDTVKAFIGRVGNQYRHIYAIEPDPLNYRTLLENTKCFQNTTCIPMGVDEKHGHVMFEQERSGSHVVKDKTSCKEYINVETDTIDNLLKGVDITYLKMDLEGMECPALRGSTRIITEHSPKLAICTYHSKEDMLLVPELICEINSSYQLYFRHYTNSVVETVCYAVEN